MYSRLCLFLTPLLPRVHLLAAAGHAQQRLVLIAALQPLDQPVHRLRLVPGRLEIRYDPEGWHGYLTILDCRVGAAQHNPPLAQFDGLHPSYFIFNSIDSSGAQGQTP